MLKELLISKCSNSECVFESNYYSRQEEGWDVGVTTHVTVYLRNAHISLPSFLTSFHQTSYKCWRCQFFEWVHVSAPWPEDKAHYGSSYQSLVTTVASSFWDLFSPGFILAGSWLLSSPLDWAFSLKKAKSWDRKRNSCGNPFSHYYFRNCRNSTSDYEEFLVKDDRKWKCCRNFFFSASELLPSESIMKKHTSTHYLCIRSESSYQLPRPTILTSHISSLAVSPVANRVECTVLGG